MYEGYLKYDLPTKFWSWIIVLAYTGILTIIFIKRMVKADRNFPSQRFLYRSFAGVFICYIINRVFFILSDFERDLNDTTILHYQFVLFAYIFSSLAFLNLLYFGEKFIIKKTKFMLSYITIVVLVIELILVFFPEMFLLARAISYGLSYALMMLVLILFIRIIIKSTGAIRTDFIITLIGFVIIAAGAILETDALLTTGIIPPWLTPLCFASGASIVTYGLRSKA